MESNDGAQSEIVDLVAQETHSQSSTVRSRKYLVTDGQANGENRRMDGQMVGWSGGLMELREMNKNAELNNYERVQNANVKLYIKMGFNGSLIF